MKYSRRKVTDTTSSRTESSPSQNKNSRASDQDEENIYTAETDVDSDDDSRPSQLTSNYETVNLEVLPDFLSDKKIYLGADLSKKVSDILERHIVAFKGYVLV